MRQYVLYDGRAMHDTDDATVIEFVGEWRGVKGAVREYKGYDYVLVSYEESGGENDELTNENVIGPISMGYKLLKQIAGEP